MDLARLVRMGLLPALPILGFVSKALRDSLAGEVPSLTAERRRLTLREMCESEDRLEWARRAVLPPHPGVPNDERFLRLIETDPVFRGFARNVAALLDLLWPRIIDEHSTDDLLQTLDLDRRLTGLEVEQPRGRAGRGSRRSRSRGHVMFRGKRVPGHDLDCDLNSYHIGIGDSDIVGAQMHVTVSMAAAAPSRRVYEVLTLTEVAVDPYGDNYNKHEETAALSVLRVGAFELAACAALLAPPWEVRGLTVLEAFRRRRAALEAGCPRARQDCRHTDARSAATLRFLCDVRCAADIV